MCGLPFSGKTTLTKKLAEKLGFARVDLDEIKFEHGFAGVSDDDVSHEDWVKIFDDMNSRIEKLLNKGNSVISDISNLEKADRDRLRAVAAHGDFPTKVIYVKVLVEEAQKRWLENRQTKARFDISEKIFNEAVETLEEPTADENVIVFDGSQTADEWIEQNFTDLKRVEIK